MDPKEAAQQFLASHHTGTLATISERGTPRARTLYYTPGESFSIYFLTLTNSNKVAELTANPAVSFLVVDEERPASLEIEGVAHDLTETATDDEHTRALLETLSARGAHFAPVTRMDASVVRLYKVEACKVRFGDFSLGQGSDAVLHDIPLNHHDER